MKYFLSKKIIFFVFLAVVLFSAATYCLAASSPDAIATRVMPNPNHLSPLAWYKANIKKQGSPQALTVDGYEAIRDGRTVYVNAANISPCPAAVGGTCFYTNIYLLSFNQNVEQATQDIFSQLLLHWKFNTNIPAANKNNVRKDTKRLADLAEIKSALNNYQGAHNGDFPSLAAGSYVAGQTISKWPSWQATLGAELGITMPLDPVNKLEVCSTVSESENRKYDPVTCWDQQNKKFAGIPANSRAYIYTYNGASYNVCALMESGYLTTLAQGACAGSTIGYAVDNCGSSAAGLGDYHREGHQCVNNRKLNDPTCYFRGTNYDYGWNNFARLWENGSWQSYCLVYNCQDNFYFKNQEVTYGGVKVAQGDCQKCSIDPASGATSMQVRSGCQNTLCANPCKITACLSGQHPASDGLTCLSNTAACTVTGGVGERYWQTSSNSWGTCQANLCTSTNFILYNGACVDCQAVAAQATTIEIVNGQCKATACASGYHPMTDGPTCESNTASCAVTGGVGEKLWQAGSNSWGTCQATSCTLANFVLYNGTCVDCRALASVSDATTVGLNAAGQCIITACISGKIPSNDGLTCVVPCSTTCTAAGQPNCKASQPTNSDPGSGNCCTGQCYQCKNNYTWNSSICEADRRNWPCTAKPDYTDWNTSDYVLQTWTGSDWQPSNASAYDTNPGTCKFKCQAGRNWNSSACVLNCTPNCSGKTCGDNGCGGSCGTCSGTETCVANNCCNVLNYTPQIKIWGSTGSSEGWGMQKIISSGNEINVWDVNGGLPRNYKFTGTNVAGNIDCANGRISKAYGSDNKLYFQHYNNGIYEDCGYLTFDNAYVKGGVTKGFSGGSEDLEGPYWYGSDTNYLLFSWAYNNALHDPRDAPVHGRIYFDGIEQQICCTPNCAGKTCGDNGCGGSCGTCTAPNICSDGACCPFTADIQVCADNQHETYFNGIYVSSASDWSSVQAFPVNIITGKNVIAVKAADWGGIWGFSATLNRGTCTSMNTNEQDKWKCTSSPGSDWKDINYDDSSWPTAITTGGPGIRAGNYLTYNQIWASDANYAGSTVYCRYSFTAN